MVYAVRLVQLCMAFSSRVKPKHGILADYQHTASYPDDQHYRTVYRNFMLTNNGRSDFVYSKLQCYCTVLTCFSYILYKAT